MDPKTIIDLLMASVWMMLLSARMCHLSMRYVLFPNVLNSFFNCCSVAGYPRRKTSTRYRGTFLFNALAMNFRFKFLVEKLDLR